MTAKMMRPRFAGDKARPWPAGLRINVVTPPKLRFGEELEEEQEPMSVFRAAKEALCRTVLTRGALTLLAAAAGSGVLAALAADACPLLQGAIVGGFTSLFIAALYWFRAATAPPPPVYQAIPEGGWGLRETDLAAGQTHKAELSAASALSEPAAKVVGQARAIAAGVLPEEQEVVRLFLAFRAGFVALRVGAIDGAQHHEIRNEFLKRPRSDALLTKIARDFHPSLETVLTKNCALEVYSALLADAGGPAAELAAKLGSKTGLAEEAPPPPPPLSPYWAVSAAAALGAQAGVGAAWPACAPPTLGGALGAAGGAVFGVAAVCGAAAAAAARARRARERWAERANLESMIETFEDMYGYESGVFGERELNAMTEEDETVNVNTLFDAFPDFPGSAPPGSFDHIVLDDQ